MVSRGIGSGVLYVAAVLCTATALDALYVIRAAHAEATRLRSNPGACGTYTVRDSDRHELVACLRTATADQCEAGDDAGPGEETAAVRHYLTGSPVCPDVARPARSQAAGAGDAPAAP